MGHRKLGRVVASIAACTMVVGLGATGGGSASGAAGVHPASAACSPGWTLSATAKLGSGTNGAFEGASALGPTDMWAVGLQVPGTSLQTLAEHWDGNFLDQRADAESRFR